MFSPLPEFIEDFTSSRSSSESSAKTIMISDEVKCDADFLVNHFLHAFVKAETPTVFLHLAQTFSHYNLVGSKCGVNLQAATEKKILTAIDGMKLLSEAPAPSSVDDPPLTSILFDAVIGAVDAAVSQVDLPTSALTRIHPPLLVVIDDLSLLSALGVSHRHLIAFILSLRRRLDSLPTTLLFRLHGDIEDGDDLDDDEIHLVKFFAHQVEAHFRVRGLTTGYCRDVHGAIDLYHRVSSGVAGLGDGPQYPDSDSSGQVTVVRNVKKQFKISEKGVVVFAPGLSAAVL